MPEQCPTVHASPHCIDVHIHGWGGLQEQLNALSKQGEWEQMGTLIDEATGKAAEGVIITTSLDRDSDVPETRNFIDAFEKRAGFKVDMVAASAHTAIMVAADALKRAGSTDPEALRKAIAATNLKASTGKISFNALGEVMKSVQNQVVKDGNWHRHSVIDDPALLAPPDK